MTIKIIGHTAQQKTLIRLLGKKKLPHAVLFAGPAGIGKYLVAKALAQTLLCEQDQAPWGGCGGCQTCKLVQHENHPDLHQVNCIDREQATVDDFRNLLNRLSLQSYYGKNRVIILRDVEHLDVRIANLLLKSFEEPRPNVYFILTAANPGRLPQTLLSRCQSWHFDALTAEDSQLVIRGLLASAPIDSPLSLIDVKTLARLSDGSVENLSDLATHAETLGKLEVELSALAKGNTLGLTPLIDSVAKDKEAVRPKLALMRLIAREQMKTEPDLLLKRRWALLLEKLLQADPLIFNRNINAGYLLTSILLSFAGIGEDLTFPVDAELSELTSLIV